MSLEEIVIPELFERLRYDVDQLGVDLHRLQRFVELRLRHDALRQAGDIQRLEQFVELCLRHDVTQMEDDVLRLQRFVELCAFPEAPAPAPAGQREETTPAAPAFAPVRRGEVIHASALGEVRRGDPVVIHVSALGEESIEKIPSLPGGRTRDEMMATARKVALEMVERFELLRDTQGQSTASGLTWAVQAMRNASADFECPQTLQAIVSALAALDLRGTSAEGEANG